MFVLKGFWDDEPAYYMNINDHIPHGMTFVHLTTDIKSATIFQTSEEAEEACLKINPEIFKIYPVCPLCGEDYDGYPAISRKDNKTKICSKCGTNESLIEFIKYQKKTTNL